MLSSHEKNALELFDPMFLILRGVYELFVLLVCISIQLFISDYSHTIILYSYIAIYATIVTFVIVLTGTCLKIILYLGYKYTRTQIRIINFLDYLRDGLLTVIFVQLFITSNSFWISVKFNPFGLSYSSFMSHTIVILLVFIEILFTVMYISWYVLPISMYYTFCYYFFLLTYFFHHDTWIYTALDPAIDQYWIFVVFAVPIGQGVFFIIFYYLNFLKNKIYAQIFINTMNPTLLKVELIFGVTNREESRYKIFLVSTMIVFLVIYSCVINLILLATNFSSSVFRIQFVFEILYTILECFMFFFYITFVYVDFSIFVLFIFSGLSYILLIIKSIFCLAGIYSFYGQNTCWIYFGSLSFVSMTVFLKVFLDYFVIQLDKSVREKIIYTNYFDQ
jgi:hypothetical protein